MQFLNLEREEQLEEISEAKKPQVILKHNTTCPISKGVLDRLQEEKGTIQGVGNIYLLDLLSNRELSNAIAERFGVAHQSPQVLLVKNGRCAYNEWGFDITSEAIRNAVENE